MSASVTSPTHVHRLHEDIVAGLTGTLIVALGIALLSKATLLTGGTAGLALLLQYATGFGFGPIFLVVNLPFYVLSILRMGWKLTIRTFLAVLLLSYLSSLTFTWLNIEYLEPIYAAVAGGTLAGLGLLILFRHRTSLGGINLLALYAQERYGLRAGYVQFAIDALILLGSLLVVSLEQFALSLLATVMINLVIANNHKPGRYMGVS